MDRFINLCQLKAGCCGVIVSICSDDGLFLQLERFGVTPGTKVIPVLTGPLGGLRAYDFSTILLALRDNDARSVIVAADNECLE